MSERSSEKKDNSSGVEGENRVIRQYLSFGNNDLRTMTSNGSEFRSELAMNENKKVWNPLEGSFIATLADSQNLELDVSAQRERGNQ